ncbi:MAG: Hsp70 family protein [Pirellulaceae bacterium]
MFCPFTLGVEVARELGGQIQTGFFTPVLHRNTIPVSKEQIFYTMAPNQTEVEVRVRAMRKVADNVFLGELMVSNLPPSPEGTPFFIRFSYDVSGVLEVEAYAHGGKKFRTVLTSHVKGAIPKIDRTSSTQDPRTEVLSAKTLPISNSPTVCRADAGRTASIATISLTQ